MAKEFIIYCDESAKKGKYFSNFYGGVIVSADHIDHIKREIRNKKESLNMHGEVKWNKITEPYKNKYIDLVNFFFDFVEKGHIKVRIMFTQNSLEPVGLSQKHIEDEYFILYYQFIKHAFGLRHCNPFGDPISLRIYLDRIPDTKEKTAQFRGYICNLSKNPEFKRAKIFIKEEDVTDVVSHEHDILQCLDIILGAMNFHLNDLHKEKPPGQRIRGKRTRAKDAVYKEINRRIRAIYPNFNIGISTGAGGDIANRWHHPYRHWRFVSSQFKVIDGMSKHKK